MACAPLDGRGRSAAAAGCVGLRCERTTNDDGGDYDDTSRRDTQLLLRSLLAHAHRCTLRMYTNVASERAVTFRVRDALRARENPFKTHARALSFSRTQRMTLHDRMYMDVMGRGMSIYVPHDDDSRTRVSAFLAHMTSGREPVPRVLKARLYVYTCIPLRLCLCLL